MSEDIDINETLLWQDHPKVLEKLLIDHTTSTDTQKKNIFWATDSYASRGSGFQFHDEILPDHITGTNGKLIQPRALKSQEEQAIRVKDKAEVFTPSWVCNAQNNLVDDAWFGRSEVFNKEIVTAEGTHTWISSDSPISFEGTNKTWQDYVCDKRLEITCGEAPYLVSRYDTVSGLRIEVNHRIGLLDRKLRVISENVDNSREWIFWAKVALSSIYGYEWQGDNLLLAREAIFFTVIDFYEAKFHKRFPKISMDGMAYIISWNLWQMDGLRCVIPDSCNQVYEETQDLFDPQRKLKECPACKKGDLKGHIGMKCKIVEWKHSISNRRVTKAKEEEFIQSLTTN